MDSDLNQRIRAELLDIVVGMADAVKSAQSGLEPIQAYSLGIASACILKETKGLSVAPMDDLRAVKSVYDLLSEARRLLALEVSATYGCDVAVREGIVL